MIGDWQIRSIDQIAKTTSGGTPSRRNKDFYTGNVLWIKSGELDDNFISDSEEKITEEAIARSSAKLFPAGTVLMAMYGATVGKTAILKTQATTNQAVCGIMPDLNICNNEFLRFQLIFKREDFLKQRYGGAQPNISQTIIRNFEIVLPTLPEQLKITFILSTVQKGIEQQDKLIRQTTELKKSLMQKLFSESIKDEKQKQTEIGMMPESWKVVELGKCLILSQYGLSVKGNENGAVPILRMTNQQKGYIESTSLQYVNIGDKELIKFRLAPDDVIFNRTNSFELVGRTSIFKLGGNYVFASYLIRLRTNKEELLPDFLNVYFNSEETQRRLKSIATRGVSQSNISATRLSGFLIPLPPIRIQSEIIRLSETMDSKINFHEKRKKNLTDLFRTLLYELMTGQRRVNEIDFPGMAKEYSLSEVPLSMAAEQ